MPAAASDLFKALADPTRCAIYERLVRDGELTVSALTRHARVSQPAVSQHLGVLRAAGLVAERREGRSTHYRAEPTGLAPLTRWLETYATFWRGRFARLERLLKEMD
jgi:DNA-binding transcriptional ArsR family regulator